ncbi:MAG: T9SS type A sorting domain-containing protein [Bacteroidales bacterium]|nr:T9SS type A sorting domain-containing protein [Bacteroidales bacterium]
MRHIYVIILLSITLIANTQPWMYELSKKKSTREYNFFEIRDAFNRYWEDKSVEKGKGFKQFKRWEYFMEQRVDSSGYLPYDIINAELLKLFEQNSTMGEIGTPWSIVGPYVVPRQINTNAPGGIGRINCIAFHPTDSNIIWVGAPTGGAWKTTNGGRWWTTSTDALAGIGISDIAINPKDPNTIYLATGDGDYGVVKSYSIGIIKSADGGETWQPTQLAHLAESQVTFRRILINPDFPEVMLATSSIGIYGTANGWNIYKRVIDGHFTDMEYKPGNYSVIYATTLDYGGNARIYRSVDGGESFQQTMSGMSVANKVNRIEIAVTPANPSIVYALCSDALTNGFYALYKSVNSGTTWGLVYDNTKINLLGWNANGSDIGGQGTYDLSMAVSPLDENEIYVGGVNVWRSDDGGNNWKINGLWYANNLIPYIHADHHTLIFNPHNNALFSGNDGGIYKTYNKGEHWQDISSWLGILQIYRMANTEANPLMMLAGNQDNGTIMYDSQRWSEIIGGDGMECFIDYDDNNIIYGTLYYGELKKSTNRGLSFDSVPIPTTRKGAWITPFVMHPEFPGILYAGFDKVYKTINGGATWTTLSPFQTGYTNLQVIALAPSDDKILYIATRSDVYRSGDDGKTWSNITAGLPSNYKTSIAVSETNANRLWVAFSGYSSGNKIFKSDDGGFSWINYSIGLPNLPVNCMVYQKSSNQAVYAGTDAGVYYRNASMNKWVKYGSSLPNVPVYDLEILYSTGKIRAATHGRGIWEAEIYRDPLVVYPDFRINTPVACADAPVTFYDYSYGNFDSLIWNFGEGSVPATAKGAGPFNVNYLTTGKKSVSLTGYIGSTVLREEKKDIIEVSNNIDFTVTPDESYLCKGNTVHLYASGGYEHTWYPSALSDTLTGKKISVSPENNISYTVKAVNGGCEASKTIQLLIISNDAVCDAILLNEGANGPFSNTCAGAEENEPVPPKGSDGVTGCESQDGWCDGELRIDNSVWFKFIAPENGVVSIQTEGFDNQVAVYDAASCEDILHNYYNLLKANDDFPGRTDYAASIQELSGLTPGKTYWLQVDGSYGGVTGKFSIQLNHAAFTGFENMEAPDEKLRFKVFPNPNTGNFIVQYSLLEKGNITINVLNTYGKKIHSESFRSDALSGQHTFTLGNLHNGLYLVELNNAGRSINHKVIIRK